MFRLSSSSPQPPRLIIGINMTENRKPYKVTTAGTFQCSEDNHFVAQFHVGKDAHTLRGKLDEPPTLPRFNCPNVTIYYDDPSELSVKPGETLFLDAVIGISKFEVHLENGVLISGQLDHHIVPGVSTLGSAVWDPKK